MSNNKNNPASKCLEILDNSTKETRNALDTNMAKGINKFCELMKATPIGIKIDTYIAERPYKLEKAIEEMKNKYDRIPEERRIEPTAFVALQTVNNLNYSLDEDFIRNMFENILISDMDKNTKSIVQPGFIEIVKQLSKEDAAFLVDLKNKGMIRPIPVIRLKIVENSSNAYDYITDNIICLDNGNYMNTSAVVIDNLLRLKIIDIPTDEYLSDDEFYSDCYNKVLECSEIQKYKELQDRHIDFQKRKIDFTSYGLDFIKVCLD